jgi:MerR-like DNA binding protein
MRAEELLLNDFTLVSLGDIATASGLSAADVEELVALGALEPTSGAKAAFSARCIEVARSARRLQIDFDLPLQAIALVLAYRERIRQLEAQLRALECQLPARRD